MRARIFFPNFSGCNFRSVCRVARAVKADWTTLARYFDWLIAFRNLAILNRTQYFALVTFTKCAIIQMPLCTMFESTTITGFTKFFWTTWTAFTINLNLVLAFQ